MSRRRNKKIVIGTHERGKEAFRAAARDAGMSMSEFGRAMLNEGYRHYIKTQASVLETRANVAQIGAGSQ